jgi:polyhydroxyalkanoate synthesis regulator phasin
VPLRRVLPDTNACYPISLLDLILRLDEAALHQVIWTEDLLEELAQTWVDNGARSRESAEKICDDIRQGFTTRRPATPSTDRKRPTGTGRRR